MQVVFAKLMTVSGALFTLKGSSALFYIGYCYFFLYICNYFLGLHVLTFCISLFLLLYGFRRCSFLLQKSPLQILYDVYLIVDLIFFLVVFWPCLQTGLPGPEYHLGSILPCTVLSAPIKVCFFPVEYMYCIYV